MLESRRSYGYRATSGKTDKETLKKYQVFYRSEDGGFGEIGYILFNTEKEARKWGEEFKKTHSYVTEIIVRHPNATYSNY